MLAIPGVLREVAHRFGVSKSYVCQARDQHNKLGQTSPGAQHNQRPLRAQVAKAPAKTLRELCPWMRSTHSIEVGTTTLHKTLGRFGLTLKKNNPARRRAGAARCGSGAHALEG